MFFWASVRTLGGGGQDGAEVLGEAQADRLGLRG